MNKDLPDLSLGTLIVLKPIHYLLTNRLGAAPENIPNSFASWRSNCCLPYRHFRTEQISKYTRCGFIHSEDDKPNTTHLQQSHHIFMFNQIFLSCQAPSAVSIFGSSLFVSWFWGGELLRAASAHTKLQAAARQRPCRWPLFTKLMEAESLQLQMVVPRGKCVKSSYASQFIFPKLVAVYGESWYFTQHPNGFAQLTPLKTTGKWHTKAFYRISKNSTVDDSSKFPLLDNWSSPYLPYKKTV